MFPEIGELVFSLVVGYMGALEFLYVFRHLYHLSFGHNTERRDPKSEAESLQKLQDQLRNSITDAGGKEAAGLKAMKDGVLYKDGFRVNADQEEIDQLKEKLRMKEQTAERQREIEAELARQKKIEEETRIQLKEAEEELRRIEEAKRRENEEKRRAEEEEDQRRQRAEEEENTRKILEAEKKKEKEQRLLEEEEENMRKLLAAKKEEEERQRQQELEEEETARKLFEAEKEREEKQRQQDLEDEEIIRRLLIAEREREEEEENAQRLLEAEREREEIYRLRELEEENNRKLLEAERELQEEQRRLEEEQTRQRIEEEENYRRLLQMEREVEERERQAEEERKALLEHTTALERETAERLLVAEREAELNRRQIEENEENMRNLLQAEQELELRKQEMEEEAENLRQLLEAEKEMEERQRIVDEEALQKLKNAQEEVQLKQTYDDEEASEQPIVRKEIGRSENSPTSNHTVKTQYGQVSTDALKPKTLLFPSVSEESSSAEPVSSKQSSFSTQQSSEAVLPEVHFEEYERQAPDGGEDMPSLQYSDEYLRSLDGIKNKPLVREDGSGRRRAFKKRRSSGSSTSSRESRASREEELKMFTSLEEEEFENIRKGDSEYESIKYASEPNLKVGKQHRRHKRSPAKDAKRDTNDAAKGSLQMLDEEESNPWGEVKRENYKDTEFWQREKNLSIDEELEETEGKQRMQAPSLSAVNIPKMSSFEEATKSQHEEAISVLKRQRSKDPEPMEGLDEESDTMNVSRTRDARLTPAGSNSPPASASASISPALISPEPDQANSHEADDSMARTPSPSSTSGSLRRSPRVDEMKEYQKKWKSEDRKARVEAGENPAIEIDYASDDELMPQPEEEEFLMEGISDFYDFNASINPSRSRSRSRSKTPAVSRSVSPQHQSRTPSPQNISHNPATTKTRTPSPDPASYKFINQRIPLNIAADEQCLDGLSDFYDFNSKLNRETLTGVTAERSNEVHRTSVDYVMEDLSTERLSAGGAIAKQIDELRRTPTTPEYERSISAEWRDVQKLKEELLSGTFKRSTYVGESMDFSDKFESLREEAKTFRRSRSQSRSPVNDLEDMTARVLAKKELQEKILMDITKTAENLEDFSCDITKSYVDRNRRASDTALIQKPEILFQIQDLIQEGDENSEVLEFEAEEYHHFRRFSLNQEIPVEQYPEEYAEIEVKSLGDLRMWTGDMESPSIEQGSDMISDGFVSESIDQEPHEVVLEEAYESGSDDERQTVVEVEDEIDEDIWDYNERPEESHNEQSECEEADREIDRYAGRNADDWRDVDGAVGGVSDEDSFQIDQIYDEAIKNRKPSGILRDYDSIIQDIQITDEDRLDVESSRLVSNGNGNIRSPRSRSSRASSGESSRSFLESERRENERRYLGDATMSAINSTRLRSRYGIVPSTSFTTTYNDDTTDIEINYVPKKEYNWRKNFKLDDEEDEDEKENRMQYLDSRKFSLGGESITLFSRSPEHSGEEGELKTVIESDADVQEQLEEEMEQEPEEMAIEKPSKKKKTKRKSRKNSQGNEEETQKHCAIGDADLPKSKSRRESKGVITESAIEEASLQNVQIDDSPSKKKSKKRRKSTKQETIILPSLNLPSPEKKQPPPSVAALRATLTASPVEAKPSSQKSRKIENLISPQLPQKVESPTIEPNTASNFISFQSTPIEPASPNGESDRLRSKTPEPSHEAAQTTATVSKTDQTDKKEIPKPLAEPNPYDILLDGGLYPLF